MKYEDVEGCYYYANAGLFGQNAAYISKVTGKTYWNSSMGVNEEELPDDIDFNDDYVMLPSKRDLDLDQYLVWKFIRMEAPEWEQQVRGIFRSRGAYARYRDFLESKDLIEKWYDFENKKEKEALVQWCEDNKISLEE